MAKTKVYVRNNQNEVKVPTGIRLLIRRCCQAVLTEEKFNDNAEVSVSFVSNKEIQRLNKFYRDKDRSTDVLSFPLGDNGEYDVNPETDALLLGDIVISLQTAVAQADMYGHSLEREIGFLTVHSMLHLLGYDHETSKIDAANMHEKEEIILSNLGISRDSTFVNKDE